MSEQKKEIKLNKPCSRHIFNYLEKCKMYLVELFFYRTHIYFSKVICS